LEKFISETHVHGKRRGRHDKTTTKNLANIEVDVELQGVEMSRVVKISILEQYLGNRPRRGHCHFHFDFTFVERYVISWPVNIAIFQFVR
jgi:hypothetical protein